MRTRIWHHAAAPLLLGLGILATLLREILLGSAYGTSRDLEVFRVAFGLPATLGQCLAPAFVGVALPLLAAADERGREAGLAARRRLSVFAARFALGACAVIVLTAPWLVAAMAPGFDAGDRDTAAVQLRWLTLVLLGLGASYGLRARLNRAGIFWPGAATSLCLSLGIAGGALLPTATGTPSTTPLVAAAAVAAWVVFVLHLVPRASDTAPTAEAPRPVLPAATGDPNAQHAAERGGAGALPTMESGWGLLAAVFGASLYQLAQAVPRFLDRGFASGAPGELAALEFSYNVLTAPGILFGTSLVMLAFPSFVREASAHRARAGMRRLAPWFAVAVGAAAAVTLACQFAAEPIVRLLYQRGSFTADDATLTAEILRWQALGLPAMVACMALAQALLGLRRLRLLLLVGALRIVVRTAALAWWAPSLGPKGLGLAYAATEVVSLAALAFILWRVSAPPRDAGMAAPPPAPPA